MKTIENNSRHELTHPQWIIDRTPYAKGKKRSTNGRPKLNVNGLVFVLKTECAWADMPKVFGSYVTTCWRRLKQWQKDGIWE
jgi:transposase